MIPHYAAAACRTVLRRPGSAAQRVKFDTLAMEYDMCDLRGKALEDMSGG